MPRVVARAMPQVRPQAAPVKTAETAAVKASQVAKVSQPLRPVDVAGVSSEPEGAAIPGEAATTGAEPARDMSETVVDGTAWSDEAAESAFLAEARDRGEPVKASPAAVELAEDAEPKVLPKLDDLVERIPANVRDTLEDLFRAKFVRVQRVPKRALKS